MALNPDKLSSAQFYRTAQWDDRDVITYALATGHSADGISLDNLKYLYEKKLIVVPSFASVLARNSAPTIKDLGGDYSKTVLANTQITLNTPLPSQGRLSAVSSVIAVQDKGIGKGALVTFETTLKNENEHYASVLTTFMARADGGCGNFGKKPAPTPFPNTKPNQSELLTTRADQAALYRLLGDRNPLHIDINAAKKVGFEQPILHGLCTYGIAYRGLMQTIKQEINVMGARFTAPVFPGETLRLDIWTNTLEINFELWAVERNVRVLSQGHAQG